MAFANRADDRRLILINATPILTIDKECGRISSVRKTIKELLGVMEGTIVECESNGAILCARKYVNANRDDRTCLGCGSNDKDG